MWHEIRRPLFPKSAVSEKIIGEDLSTIHFQFALLFWRPSPKPSLREISRRFVKFRDSSANASQTSVSDNMLGVRGLLRMCVEKYWEVVWREELLLVLQLMDTFGRVQIRIVQIMVRYFLKNDRKRYHVTATIFSFFEEQIARLLPFASICLQQPRFFAKVSDLHW